MKVKEIENGVIVEGVMHFNAKHIFECGQCFRWKAEADGSYTGVAFGRVLNVKTEPIEGKPFHCNIILNNTNIEDFNGIWYNYFDLGRDYSMIIHTLGQDAVLKAAADYGYGIRILNQEPWEMLISFIISANNNIPRIVKCIQRLCEAFGEPINYEGKVYYAFPDLEALSSCGFEGISLCRAGFRCKYIYETVKKLRLGELDLAKVREMPAGSARKELMRLSGVGPKVADCIMLFSMQKYEVYPLDVWVKRVTEYYYFHKEVKLAEIQLFACNKFGSLAGFAQQYLFYFARENKKAIEEFYIH